MDANNKPATASKPKCSKTKNPCKICLQRVSHKNGLRCEGACKRWIHYKCCKFTPGKIADIKAGVIKVTCPCPDCYTAEPKEFLTKPSFNCADTNCPTNQPPKCTSPECPLNAEGGGALMLPRLYPRLQDNESGPSDYSGGSTNYPLKPNSSSTSVHGDLSPRLSPLKQGDPSPRVKHNSRRKEKKKDADKKYKPIDCVCTNLASHPTSPQRSRPTSPPRSRPTSPPRSRPTSPPLSRPASPPLPSPPRSKGKVGEQCLNLPCDKLSALIPAIFKKGKKKDGITLKISKSSSEVPSKCFKTTRIFNKNNGQLPGATSDSVIEVSKGQDSLITALDEMCKTVGRLAKQIKEIMNKLDRVK